MKKRNWSRPILLGLMALGFASGFVTARVRSGKLEVDPWVVWIAMAAAFALIVGGSLLWWRSIDEAQREAHKSAWLWGGSFGMLAGLAALVLAAQLAPGLLASANPDSNPVDFAVLGFGVAVLAQNIGYGLAWLLWWAGKR